MSNSQSHPPGPKELQMQYPHLSCPSPEKMAYVYVISVGGHRPCKIGFARNPWTRVSHIQGCTHQALELTAICGLPANKVRAVEMKLHRLFGPKRLRGEWFDIVADEAVVELAKFGEVVRKPPVPANVRQFGKPVPTEEELIVAAKCHPLWA